MPQTLCFLSQTKSRNKIFSVMAFLILCLLKRLLFLLAAIPGLQLLEEVVALIVHLKMNAGKFSTSIFQIASIPSSGYSTHSTF